MTPILPPHSVLAICWPLILAKDFAPLEPHATKAQREVGAVVRWVDSFSLALLAFHLLPDLQSITKLLWGSGFATPSAEIGPSHIHDAEASDRVTV